MAEIDAELTHRANWIDGGYQPIEVIEEEELEAPENWYVNNRTIKDTKINIQLKLGHYPVKQKIRHNPLHL